MSTDNGTKPTVDELDVPAIKEKCTSYLNPIELETYEEWRADFTDWALKEGRKPSLGEGYSVSTIEARLYNVDDFWHWVWNQKDGFTLTANKEAAKQYWSDEIKYHSVGTARKYANVVQMVLRYDNVDWSIPNSKDLYEEIGRKQSTTFTDWFRRDELKDIRTASLSVYAVPSRENMTVEEEGEWANHLAQRLKKPRHELSEDDWESANSYKIPSLVYVSCDVGLRPCEVERASVDWVNMDKKRLDIPKKDSSKNDENWHCYFGDDTVRLLRKWIDERDKKDMYKDTDAIWLTREGNPYCHNSLRRPTMRKLMAEAGMNVESRENGWYMIRRGVGTELAHEQGIDEMMQQLRIKTIDAARRYIHHEEDPIRDWLNNR